MRVVNINTVLSEGEILEAADRYGVFRSNDGYAERARLIGLVRELAHKQRVQASTDAREAHERIFDMLLGDDGQAYKEAGRYLERAAPDLAARLNDENPTSAPVCVPSVELAAYDAGLLSDSGGGDVGWWQDYMRAELGYAHDFYQSQVEASLAPKPPAGKAA